MLVLLPLLIQLLLALPLRADPEQPLGSAPLPYPSTSSLLQLHSAWSSMASSHMEHGSFHPVVMFHHPPPPLDLSSSDSQPPPPCSALSRLLGRCAYPAGGYDELRFLYTQPLFAEATVPSGDAGVEQRGPQYVYGGRRDVHVGVDVMCPAGKPVYAPAKGTVWAAGYNGDAGDYGGVVITRHALEGPRGVVVFYVLFGHLSRRDAQSWAEGDAVEAGTFLARVGKRSENGGWEPHLHLQVQLTEPKGRDMPGVVARDDRERALREFPDPAMIMKLEKTVMA
jgi:murein DD-endopeptidase MepM/ murein hydrolase activator NlpD